MNIITDRSPYYIELFDPSTAKVKAMLNEPRSSGRVCLGYNIKVDSMPYAPVNELMKLPVKRMKVVTYDRELGQEVIDALPYARDLQLNPHRVSLFLTSPGAYYPIHKDGLAVRFGINLAISIMDGGCLTSWYDDELDRLYTRKAHPLSREFNEDIDLSLHPPLATYTMMPNTAVLFNTDVYHDFHNDSPYLRAIITIRYTGDKLTFADAAEIIKSYK